MELQRLNSKVNQNIQSKLLKLYLKVQENGQLRLRPAAVRNNHQ